MFKKGDSRICRWFPKGVKGVLLVKRPLNIRSRFLDFAPDVFSSIRILYFQFNEFKILFGKTNENFYEKC